MSAWSRIVAAGPAVLVLVVSTAALLVLPQVVLAPVLALLPRGQRGHPEHARAPWALVTPAFAALLAAVFLIQASTGAWGGFFALHVRALGLSDSLPGIAFALPVLLEMFVFHAGRRLLVRVAPADLILVTLAATVVRWVLSALVTSEAGVVLVQLGHVFTFSVLHLAAVALVAELVPPENATSGQSLYGGIGFGVGATVGIAFAGLLVDRVGTIGLFWAEAGVATLALAPALALRRLRAPARAVAVRWHT